MTTTVAGTLSESTLDTWASDPTGPIALHLKQKLLPVGDEVIFPPTYADIGYNIDTLSDGTMVATIDSVGSQANRMEPIFKAPVGSRRDDWLVPQLEIELRDEERRSILDLAHRSGDAVVRASGLSADIEKAFKALQKTGDAGPLCVIAPTSLLFGVWDSRGTGEKRPRLVRAIIRAWDVEPLHAAAQYNSPWKAFNDEEKRDLENAAAKIKKGILSEKGFKDAPAVFRKTARGVPQTRDGALNPDARVLGGVLVRGQIEREVTINLIALRNLRGKDAEETRCIQRYLLGLSLLAATTEIELSLREGCLLRYADDDRWRSIPRRGEPQEVDLSSTQAQAVIDSYAQSAAEYFRVRWPQETVFKFDMKEAKALLAKKDDEETSSEA